MDIFNYDFASDLMLKHFNTSSLKGFGIESYDLGIIAAGVILHYLKETHHHKLNHISNISRIEEDQFVWLDRFTINNLELIHSPHEKAVTLIETIDRTVSPMGSRLLKRWIVLPLKNKATIHERLNIVDYLFNDIRSK